MAESHLAGSKVGTLPENGESERFPSHSQVSANKDGNVDIKSAVGREEKTNPDDNQNNRPPDPYQIGQVDVQVTEVVRQRQTSGSDQK